MDSNHDEGNNSNDQSVSMVQSDNEDDQTSNTSASNAGVEASSTNKNDNIEGDPDESFLDDDFLSFDRVENGGNNQEHDVNGMNSNSANSNNGRMNNKEGLPSSAVDFVNGALAQQPYLARSQEDNVYSNNHSNGYNTFDNTKKPIAPWLDDTNDFSQQSQTLHNDRQLPDYPQPQQQSRNQNYNSSSRGYSGAGTDHGRNPYYQRPPPPPIIKLHNEMVSFVNLMSPTEEELRTRDVMVERVTALAQRVFGGKDKCLVLPFGSQMTGLCLPNSDIDFVIRFPDENGKDEGSTKKNNTAQKGEQKSKTTSANSGEEEDEEYIIARADPLNALAKAVREEFGVLSKFEPDVATPTNSAGTTLTTSRDKTPVKEHLSYLEVISQTRVPLVKFTVAPYDIDIDVCFNQPGGPESAELMHRFMYSMPPLRPLTFVLKYFLASREINKPFTGGIGSYLLQLMIVSFLQHRSREEINDRGRSASLGTHFNLGSLLLDFLELYGMDFNYVTTGISVRTDGYYFPKGSTDKKPVFWQPSRPFMLAMENPLDITADVGAGAYRIQMIKNVFEHAFKTLMAYVSEPLEETDSILAKIIPPTEEMEKRRVFKMVSNIEEAVVMASSGNGADVGDDNRNNEESDDEENTRKRRKKKSRKLSSKKRRS